MSAEERVQVKFPNQLEKDSVQDIILNHLVLKVNITCEKDEKSTTNFEASKKGDVENKTYLGTKLFKEEGFSSHIGEEDNEFKSLSYKQNEEEVPIESCESDYTNTL